MRTRLTLVVLALVGAGGPAGGAAEESIPLAAVPPEAVAVLHDRFPGVTVWTAAVRPRGRSSVYAVEVRYEGRTLEVTLTRGGTILRVEEAMPPEELPAAVAKALQAKYPGAAYERAARVTKGRKRSYEALLVTPDNRAVEVAVTPKGKITKAKWGGPE
jgi:hypothetical protein